MGIWDSIKVVAKNAAIAANPKEEPIEKPVQIMLVKEPQRSKRQQLHDMINLGRDTDNVKRTKSHMSSITNGTSFNTSCDNFCIPGTKQRRARKTQNPWRTRI